MEEFLHSLTKTVTIFHLFVKRVKKDSVAIHLNVHFCNHNTFKSAIFLQLLDRLFSFQNNPKNLDPSYKMDLDLWDSLGRVKFILYPNLKD